MRQWNTARDDGAVAVEAALLLPILFIILFGILDSALDLRDVAAAGSVARHGARIASAEPRRASMPDDVAAAVARAASALPPESIDELWVYQADAHGLPLTAPSLSACVDRCLRMTWNATQRTFVRSSGRWPPEQVNACVGDPRSMSVGVLIKVRHRMLFSSLLGGSTQRTIGERAVMRFEPMPSRSCGFGVS